MDEVCLGRRCGSREVELDGTGGYERLRVRGGRGFVKCACERTEGVVEDEGLRDFRRGVFAQVLEEELVSGVPGLQCFVLAERVAAKV